MRKEIEMLEKFIREKGLRYTPQREEVLKIFLSIEKHLSADEVMISLSENFLLTRKNMRGIPDKTRDPA